MFGKNTEQYRFKDILNGKYSMLPPWKSVIQVVQFLQALIITDWIFKK